MRPLSYQSASTFCPHLVAAPAAPANDCTSSSGGGNPKGGNGSDPRDNGNDGTDPPGEVAPPIDTSGPSSVPVPLLVLGGLSLALLAAGGLGYVSRRRQAAHADDVGNDDTLV